MSARSERIAQAKRDEINIKNKERALAIAVGFSTLVDRINAGPDEDGDLVTPSDLIPRLTELVWTGINHDNSTARQFIYHEDAMDPVYKGLKSVFEAYRQAGNTQAEVNGIEELAT